MAESDLKSDDHSPQPKKPLVTPKIGTHNGTFHCDEALACFMLKQLPEYKHADIIRTRNPEELSDCDIVVDVGGVYDAEKHRYDHHQRSFTGCMKTLNPNKPWVTKLSSAGLVYLHFGQRVISQILKTKEENDVTRKIYDKIYENFVQEIDAIDNGISQCDGEPRYSINTNLSSRVSHLNPRWNDPNPDSEKQFQKAMNLVGEEFLDRVCFYRDSWLPARGLVKEALCKRQEVDPSGEIIEFEEGGFPWKEHLFESEKDLNIEGEIKFVIYTDQNHKWRVQCVPVRPDSFENRLSLLEEWRGIRDEALSSLSGIQGCIFVHASGFIGGNETHDGALSMARKTLQHRNTKNTANMNNGGGEIISLSTVIVMNQKYTSVGDKAVVTPSSNGVYFEEETIQTFKLLLFPAGGLNSNNNELCEEEWKNLISHLVAPNGLTYPEVIALDSGLDIRDLSTGMANGGV